MKHIYATAIERALAQGIPEAKVADGLMAHLKSVGRLKLLPGILRELNILVARRAVGAPTIEVASSEEKAAAREAAASAGISADTVLVNETLISGWRARAKGLLVDRSGKRALIDLYRRITT